MSLGELRKNLACLYLRVCASKGELGENDPPKVEVINLLLYALVTYMQKMPCNLCMSCTYNKAPCCPITKKLIEKFQMSSKIERSQILFKFRN